MEVTLGPNLSHMKPAGNPIEIPKFPREAITSTEKDGNLDTMNPLYNDIRYNSKIRYNVNLTYFP